MARRPVGKTLSNDVCQQLRQEILSGRWPPGARLKMVQLGSELDVSLSVLREALNRLTEQGLVVLEPQAGFSVMSVSTEDLVDLTAARRHIEGAACRESVRLGDALWEGRLIAAHHVLSKVKPQTSGPQADVGPNQEWIAAHNAFHEVLIEACGSRRLQAVASSLRDSAEVYRQWSGPHGMERHRDVAAEHAALLDAALTRDAETTERLLSEHIQLTTDLLLELLEEPAAAG